jgi:CHAT domain-containing protein/tetratricopeptide (TPR) repeat protein
MVQGALLPVANHTKSKKIRAAALSCLIGYFGAFPPLAMAQAAGANDVQELRAEVEKYKQNSKKKPELADGLYRLGKALAEERNFAEAQSNLEAALALDAELGKNDAIVNDYVALALVHTYQKNYDKAQEVYTKALELAKSKSMSNWVVTINNNLGSNSIYAGKYDQAKAFFNEAKTAASAANDGVGEAQARLNLAIIYQHDGNIKEAIGEAEGARQLLSADKDPLMAAQASLNLGQLKDKIGDLEGAAKQFELATDAGGDTQIEASAWLSLGNIRLSRGQAKEAEVAFNKALDIYKGEGSAAQMPSVTIRLGCARADMGDFAAAQKLHTDAVAAARASKNNNALCAGLYELAYDYYLAGDIDKALAKFDELKNVLGSGLTVSDVNSTADAINAIALCYRALGQPAVARDYYTRAMDLYTKLDNKLAAIGCQNSIACAFLDGSNIGEYKRLHDLSARALEALPEKDKQNREYNLLRANVAYNFAQSQVIEDNFDGALKSYQDALTSFEACGYSRGRMNALRGMGLSRFLAGRASKNNALLTEAIKYFDQSKQVAVSMGSTEGQWDAAIGAGACQRTLGDNAAAEQNLKIAIQLFENEKGHFSRDDSKTFTLDLRYSAFEELVALLFDQNRYADALAIAERGRARAFLDLLEGRKRNLFGAGKLAVLTGPGADNQPGGARPEVASADTGAKPGQTGKPAPAEKPVAIVAMANIPSDSMMRGVQAVPKQGLSPADLETALSPVNAEAPNLDQIKALVASHKACAVEYFVGPDNLYIFVAHPDGKIDAVSQHVSSRDLNKLVDKTYTSVISPPANLTDLKGSNDRREKNLTDMYNVLIAPIKDLLPKEPDALVTFVPHRTLFLVPFAALMDSNRKFFIEDHTLSVIPALGVLRATESMAGELKASGGAGQDKLLAFGNPAIKMVAGLGALPYAEQEVKKIAALFGEGRSMVKIGPNATRSALTSLATNYNVIHLATHGLIDEEHPMDSAVLLATDGNDDGILSVRDILRLPPLKAHLVTLSACQTGRGRISGDGVAGLSRSFIIAGTPSVMVSLWNVDDVMTAYQMESFYKDYLASQSKAVALRAAQIKTLTFLEKGLTVQGSRANPRYWAAFQLVGEAN